MNNVYTKKRPYKNCMTFLINLVGAGGFEPPMPVPKTGALPLGYAPEKSAYLKITN